MKQVEEMEWTDGTGKALATLGAAITKQEKEIRDDSEEYFSDPEIMVMDMLTGSTVMIQTEPHTGGRTHGRGYKREKSWEQRIPMKVPLTLQRNILLDMVVGMLVPEDSDEVGALGKAAYTRIAEALKEGMEMSISTDKDLAKHWKDKYAKHSKLVTQVSEQINDMTITKMSGRQQIRVQAVPVTNAILNPELVGESVVTLHEAEAVIE
tara:strand:- start:3934 stop:4560 length:627 start_codon:yes stop_codon:yes gene_type:complete